MSGVAKFIGTVAGAVATVASFIPGAQPIAAVAAGISAVSGTIAQITAKPPTVQGSTTNVVINPNSPTPYSMGRTFVGGHIIHDVGYGPTDDDLFNPYRTTVYIYSCAGPVQGIDANFADFNQMPTNANGYVSGFYAGHMWFKSQKGLAQETRALENDATFYGRKEEIPDWGGNHKLSGYAAGITTLKLDKKGKIYGGGVPQHGVRGRWVKVYDPRLDSTYPGGSGTQRVDDEATWAYSENPALHAATYAYGRYCQNPQPGFAQKKIFGIGMSFEGIDWPQFIAAANVCDANGWQVGGTIYEPGDKWNNLKLIMQAGGMKVKWRGPILSCVYPAPKVALTTITVDDLAEGEWSVPGMQPWQNRINQIIPTFRSEEHNWEQVPSEIVYYQQYVDEDGEERPKAVVWPLVQDKDNVAQLAAYELFEAREIGPIVLPLKPRFLDYGIGDAVFIDIPELGLAHLCEIISDDYDPGSGIMTMGFITNTPDKHTAALSRTGTIPPTPTILASGELDNIRENYLAAQIADRIVGSDAYVDLQDEIAQNQQDISNQDETLEQFGLSINAQGNLIDQQGNDLSQLGFDLNEQGQLVNNQGIAITNIVELQANRDLLIVSEGAVTGISYVDPATGARVTAPHRIFWEAFELATSATDGNTPFLYDSVADVIYMDTAFIRELSVETIHVRDGAISRASSLRLTRGNEPPWQLSTTRQTFHDPIVISKGPGDGQAVFGMAMFSIRNASSKLGQFTFDVYQRRWRDEQLTQALTSSPGTRVAQGSFLIDGGSVTNTFTVGWVDDRFAESEEFITYYLHLTRMGASESDLMYLQETTYSTILTKK